MRLERTWIPALLVALLALTSGGWLLQQSSAAENGAHFNQQLLEHVHQLVSERYVEEIPPGDLYRMAVDGMLRELEDPYTSLLGPEEWEELQLSTEGQYGGLGIQIEEQGGWVTVVGVLPDTPAERSGLRTGDRIVEVEGESAEGWSTTRAVNVLRGEKGSEVTISVARVGVDRPLQFTIERAEIQVASLRSFMLDDRIGFVSLERFSRVAQDELREAVDELLEQGATALILDLRRNPGGLLDQGVAVSDLFLGEGAEVVSTRSRVPGESQVYTAPGPDAYPDLPVAVLLGTHSASASEIVAGALQDHDRAVVVGTTSFGKGSVQSLFNLPGQNYLKMTTGKWYTPSGRSIEKPRGAESRLADFMERAVSIDGEPVPARVDTAQRATYETRAGRTVYGGGGITPDLVVMPDTLTTREQVLRGTLVGQGVAVDGPAGFQFAVEWASQHPDLPRDFDVTDEMRDAFRAFIAERATEEVDPDLWEDSRAFIDWTLERQVARAAFGPEEQLKRFLGLDRQAREAIEILRAAREPGAVFTVAEERKQELKDGDRGADEETRAEAGASGR